MQRHTVITKLKPDMVAQYIALHDQIWPEVVALGHAAGLRNYSIHRVGVYLFSYFEYDGNDYEADMAWKNSHDIVKQWQAATSACFDYVVGENTSLYPEEIFYNEF